MTLAVRAREMSLPPHPHHPLHTPLCLPRLPEVTSPLGFCFILCCISFAQMSICLLFSYEGQCTADAPLGFVYFTSQYVLKVTP